MCEPCNEKWVPITPQHCSLCLYPFIEGQSSHLCGDCLGNKSSFGRLFSLGLYEDPLKNIIWRYKFREEEHLSSFFVDMFEKVHRQKNDYDLIIPIPLYPKKLRERGYNQSAILAKALSKKWKTEWHATALQKVRETPSQADLKGKERRENLKGVFQVKDKKIISKKRILLIDDVYTTGTTIREASKVLKKNGAESIDVFVIARAK